MTSPRMIPQLLILLPAGEIRIALDRERTSIGADPSCAVSPQTAGLAPFQALIQHAGETFEIFNLAPHGSLGINGQAAEAGLLKSGDQLRLGPLKAVFLWPRPASLPPAEKDGGQQVLPLAPLPPKPPSPAQAQGGGPAPTSDSAPRHQHLLATLAHFLGGPPEESPAVPTVSEATASNLPTFTHRFPTHGFTDEVVAGLKRTPWLLLSLILHILLLLVFDLISLPTRASERPLPLEASMTAPLNDLTKEPRDEEETQIEMDDLEDIPLEPEIEEPVEEPEKLLEPEESLTDEGDSSHEGPFAVGTQAGGRIGKGVFAGPSTGRGQSLHFKRYVHSLRASGLDIVFVVDSTGSMGAVLEDARRRMSEMITVLGQLVPGFRLGLVAYRDRGDAYLTKAVKLTPYRYKVLRFLDDLMADGGGDLPEDVLAGLRKATRDMPWSKKASRLIILLGDAPPHPQEVSAIRSLVKHFRSHRGTLHTIYTPEGPDAAADPQTRRFFKDLARLGKGSFVELAQDQEILLHVLEVAFGKQNRADMKTKLTRALERRRKGALRKLIAKATPKDILRELRQRRVPDELVAELTRTNRRTFLPAYLALLEDARAPLGSRWVACVLARKLLHAFSGNALLGFLADRVNPEGKSSAQSRILHKLRTLAAAEGYPVNMPASLDPSNRKR